MRAHWPERTLTRIYCWAQSCHVNKLLVGHKTIRQLENRQLACTVKRVILERSFLRQLELIKPHMSVTIEVRKIQLTEGLYYSTHKVSVLHICQINKCCLSSVEMFLKI
jgi:hypothetical protein